MFTNAIAFNSDLSDWDVSSINNMEGMFENALSFDQDLSNWDVSSVGNMDRMFSGATSFSTDIYYWDVSSLTYSNDMFLGCSSFSRGNVRGWSYAPGMSLNNLFYSDAVYSLLPILTDILFLSLCLIE